MLRSIPPPALCRLSCLLAAGALVALAAAPLAGAAQSGGGYPDASFGTRWNGTPGTARPSRWLRSSSLAFQRLMRLLSERSAWVEGADAPEAFPLPRGRPDREAEEEPAGEREPAERDDREERRWWSRRGGEARAGRDRTAPARAEEWRPRWMPSCRHAGRVSERGWYVVQPGDTLWSIAEVHYGYGGAYRRIQRANWQSVADPSRIYPCQRIYIPRWWSRAPGAQELWATAARLRAAVPSGGLAAGRLG